MNEKTNILQSKKGQMYDRHKASNKRLQGEAKHLRRKLREHGGLCPTDAARLRRVSGTAVKVVYQDVVNHSYSEE